MAHHPSHFLEKPVDGTLIQRIRSYGRGGPVTS